MLLEEILKTKPLFFKKIMRNSEEQKILGVIMDNN